MSAPGRSSLKGALARPLLESYLVGALKPLTGKIAALFAQSCKDAEGANDVEQLTTALLRKIWQKVMAFSRVEEMSENNMHTE